MGCCCNGVDNEDTEKPVEFDPTFNGPIKNRGCTDIICCILFIVCFLGMLGVAILGFIHGDPNRLLYPTDSNGKLCGFGDKEGKPNLFFFDLTDCAAAGPGVVITGCPTPQVCVKDCPNYNWVWLVEYGKDNFEKGTGNRTRMICKDGIDPSTTSEDIKTLMTEEKCAAYIIESLPVFGRCLPKFLGEAFNKSKDLFAGNDTVVDKLNNTLTEGALAEGTRWLGEALKFQEYGIMIFQDVRNAWWMILICLGIGMLFCFIWIIVMRWIAGFMVWLTIILFIGVFGFATYYCLDQWWNKRDKPEHQLGDEGLEFTTDFTYYTQLADFWLAIGIITGVFLLIIIILVIFLRKRIQIAIALIKAASRAVGSMIFTLFWPIIPFILQFILFAFWGVSVIYLASMGSPEDYGSNRTAVEENVTTADGLIRQEMKIYVDQIPCDPALNETVGYICNFVKYGGAEYSQYLQIYMLFMLFWMTNFIVALGQMTLAGAFASYYWAFHKPQDIPTFPVTASLGRTVWYHLGTLAFGSLIIAIIQMIRVALEYIDHKLKGTENAIAKFLLKCLKCCFWCLEKIIKFINKNAYILTAVYGYNFCTAAKKAFSLILRNIIRVAVVDKVTDFIVFIGKLMVVGAIGVLSFYYFSGRFGIEEVYNVVQLPDLNFYVVPIVVIVVATFVIASGFFSVYSMGVDTLFLCFLEDLERNDGTKDKPYYMSKDLMSIMGIKNEQRNGKAAKKDKKEKKVSS